jgi:hypothetical protein
MQLQSVRDGAAHEVDIHIERFAAEAHVFRSFLGSIRADVYVSHIAH